MPVLLLACFLPGWLSGARSKQRACRTDPAQESHVAGNTARRHVLRGADRTAETMQCATGRPDELFRVDLQAFEKCIGDLAGSYSRRINILALVLYRLMRMRLKAQGSSASPNGASGLRP